MAPVSPQRLKVPMLLGGAHAAEAAERLCSIGMNAKAASNRIGVASAIKMCRSVLIKGIEASGGRMPVCRPPIRRGRRSARFTRTPRFRRWAGTTSFRITL